LSTTTVNQNHMYIEGKLFTA